MTCKAAKRNMYFNCDYNILQVTSLIITDELGIAVTVSKSDDWIEIMLIHVTGKTNETFVNVTEDQKVQPAHQFQVLNASALFISIRLIPPQAGKKCVQLSDK